MALVDRLKEIETDYGGVARSCHFATTYWLFQEAFDRAPSLQELIGLGNAQLFITSLLAKAVALQDSTATHAAARLKVKKNGALVMAGSVIIFSHGHTAEHSCVARTSQRVAGYNQTDWFTSAGTPNGFTEHDTAHIKWKTKHLSERFGKEYKLFAVYESDALKAIKAQFPKLKA